MAALPLRRKSPSMVLHPQLKELNGSGRAGSSLELSINSFPAIAMKVTLAIRTAAG